MICIHCDTYPCDCHRVIGSVMSEARALVCVVLIVVTLGWAFWYGTKLQDARYDNTPKVTTESGR